MFKAHKRYGKSPNDLILGKLGHKKLGDITDQEMQQVIESLGPKKELYTGIQYLHHVLNNEGTQGVIRFVEKAHHILDNEGKLLGYDFADFGKKHPRYLKRSHINLLNRREFLNTVGWGIPGAVAVAVGIAKTGNEICNPVEKGLTPTRRDIFNHVGRWIDQYIAGPSEMLIGAALLNEAVEKWKEYKLEQVANAVAEMADLMERQQAASPAH